MESEIKRNEFPPESRVEKAKEILKYILAVVIILSFFGLLALMIFQAVPDSNNQIVNIMVGVLGTMAVTIVNFYFGSSKSSEDKTKLLSNGR